MHYIPLSLILVPCFSGSAANPGPLLIRVPWFSGSAAYPGPLLIRVRCLSGFPAFPGPLLIRVPCLSGSLAYPAPLLIRLPCLSASCWGNTNVYGCHEVDCSMVTHLGESGGGGGGVRVHMPSLCVLYRLHSCGAACCFCWTKFKSWPVLCILLCLSLTLQTLWRSRPIPTVIFPGFIGSFKRTSGHCRGSHHWISPTSASKSIISRWHVVVSVCMHTSYSHMYSCEHVQTYMYIYPVHLWCV